MSRYTEKGKTGLNLKLEMLSLMTTSAELVLFQKVNSFGKAMKKWEGKRDTSSILSTEKVHTESSRRQIGRI